MNHETSDETITDISGYAVFSHGESGAAHVMAHTLLDRGALALGRKQLGAWLAGREGAGSDWLHLQFHMGVFELGTGDWDAAYARFMEQVLPAAAATDDALTDAPGLLWRIALNAPAGMKLPWEPLRRTALRCLQRPCSEFVELHHLLALAGAEDRVSIAAWLKAPSADRRSTASQLVARVARALLAYTEHAYDEAAIELGRVAPLMPMVGGSRAQNQLFMDLTAHCRQRAFEDDRRPRYALAA